MPRRNFDFLGFDETDRLLVAVAVEPEWYPMVLTALHTGLHQGELLALRWEDVDLVAGRGAPRARRSARGRQAARAGAGGKSIRSYEALHQARKVEHRDLEMAVIT